MNPAGFYDETLPIARMRHFSNEPYSDFLPETRYFGCLILDTTRGIVVSHTEFSSGCSLTMEFHVRSGWWKTDLDLCMETSNMAWF